jgi:ADP-ribosylglycohydrolase
MKLLDRVRQALRVKHYSPRTETAYVQWIKRFLRFHDLRHPAELGEGEVAAFLTDLAVRGRIGAGTQNQALAALLFLYRDGLGRSLGPVVPSVRARETPRLPVVLTRAEVATVLKTASLEMLGAIVGDFVGSVHEHTATKRKHFPLPDPRCFVTDDSLLTVAVAEWLMDGTPLVARFHDLVAAYPAAGWGVMFAGWARARRPDPYHSFGNGAAMRASPVGWAFAGLEDTLRAAAESAAVTHNHPEGIKGAQATAAAVHLARTTRDKALIRREIAKRFSYDLDRTVDAIRPTYGFDETCQRTVPEAIIAFLDGSDFEDTLRNAVSLGGDADTLACIAGGIAHAYYGGVPEALATPALVALPGPLRGVWDRFRARYAVPA